ncbi:MAG: Bug family tripartite tricarboxylate transporter substrate binding protein [Beijerinckiaceae bacterium]
MRSRFLAVAGFCSAALFSTTTAPASAADFAGKTITFTIPFAVGGGSDVWGRFNAQFIAKYLPGQPTLVVRNRPGAGSIAGANYYAATAKPDGLEIFGTSASTQFPFLLGDRSVRYDYRKWTVLLAGPTGGAAYLSTKQGAKSLAELPNLKGKKLHYASQGLTTLDLVPLLGFRMLGLDVQHVTGFRGRGDGRLAFERGETSIDYQTTSSYKRGSEELVKSGRAVPLFSWGVMDANGNLARDPNFPEMPHFAEAYEIVQKRKPGGVEWDAMKALLVAGFAAQKLLVVPNGTPADIVEAYRNAVRQMVKDKEYLAKRQDVIGEYEQVTDAQAEKLYAGATTIAPVTRQWLRDFLTREYKVKFK